MAMAINILFESDKNQSRDVKFQVSALVWPTALVGDSATWARTPYELFTVTVQADGARSSAPTTPETSMKTTQKASLARSCAGGRGLISQQ